MIRILQAVASFCLIALIFLNLAWELWLAPLKPGGSWLILKAVVLLIPLMGILKGHRYTYQWMSMFILLYFTEGIMRGWSDKGLSATLGMIEVGLSVGFFLAAIAFAKLTAPPQSNAGT